MNFNKKFAWGASFIAVALAAFMVFFYQSQKVEFETCWGDKFTIPSEIVAIIETPAMQRLLGVDQAGPARYFGVGLPAFSRFEHSLEVWALLKMKGADIKEQAVGLLHDASHTAFSHVGDYIFAKNTSDFTEQSYQDSIHDTYMKNSGLENLLTKIGLNIDRINPDCGEYWMLEQSLPDMCADRIQYNVKTGLLFKLITEEDAKNIMQDVTFKDGKWFFNNKNLASKFAKLSVHFTKNFWGKAENTLLNICFSLTIKRALKLKIITEKDLFSTDSELLTQIMKSSDKIIQLTLQQCDNPLETIPGQTYKTEHFCPKFRGIDPLILIDGKCIRLSEIDEEFKKCYEEVEAWCEVGYDIRYLDIEV
ncbi:hypothetical protein FACS1894113_0860 [Alphaproteobacteria bacterium]|nr:hypothetical protein FACS1894113_0860 [Alphaproteobacteria bacterium]